jgi:hypothetical protein
MDEVARKIMALVAPLQVFLESTVSDGAVLAVFEQFIGETSLARDLVYSYTENRCHFLLQFHIIAFIRHIDTTGTTVQATRRGQLVSCYHCSLLL